MMNEDQDKEYQQDLTHSEAPNDGPGVLLKKAREQHGYEIGDVAIHLHLSKNVIEAIEEDDYSRFPAMTFTKGYLRAYAKFLKLDADDVIRRLSYLNIPEPVRSPVQRVIVKEVKASDKPVKWMSYIVALALGSLVILWWHNHGSSTDKLTKATIVKQPDVTTPVDAPIAPSDVADNAEAATVEKAKASDATAKPAKPLPSNVKPSNTKVAGHTAPAISTPEATATVSHSSTDDISIHHAAADTTSTTHKAHEGKKQFSGWNNPDAE